MGLQEMPTPAFGEMYHFRTDGSAILARKTRPDGTRAYLLWKDPETDQVLTHIMRQKLSKAGLTDNHMDIQVCFDRTYIDARTKLATIKNIQHKGSECPVIVSGTPEAVQFAWLVGIGDLTGSGFGGVR
ncbi:hypothetical protein GCM10023187_45640 [Nibrella viscosa]|uniref:CRISPR associated protein Cas6 C-terminal domain-containing protein n=2 Tax=Nibrella viscosa TaxID=1084524 RepID=A0ABP8KUD1_9BACT